MYELPTSVVVGDKQYPIRNNGDYRMVLDCFTILEDIELNQKERIIATLIIFYDGFEDISDIDAFSDVTEAVDAMYRFFNCGQPEDVNSAPKPKLIDWEQDSTIICSAINNVARTEVRALPYLHWWTFMGYYMAVNEGFFSTIVGIRHKLATGKKLEKYEQEFRRDNMKYFIWNSRTIQQNEADELARSLWNKTE